jgi:hypothetical protein
LEAKRLSLHHPFHTHTHHIHMERGEGRINIFDMLELKPVNSHKTLILFFLLFKNDLIWFDLIWFDSIYRWWCCSKLSFERYIFSQHRTRPQYTNSTKPRLRNVTKRDESEIEKWCDIPSNQNQYSPLSMLRVA